MGYVSFRHSVPPLRHYLCYQPNSPFVALPPYPSVERQIDSEQIRVKSRGERERQTGLDFLFHATWRLPSCPPLTAGHDDEREIFRCVNTLSQRQNGRTDGRTGVFPRPRARSPLLYWKNVKMKRPPPLNLLEGR